MLFYYHSWMFYNHFIETLYHFSDKPIDIMPSTSSCLLLVVYFAGNRYQTESKRNKTFWRFFLDQKTPVGPKKYQRGSEGSTQPTSAHLGAQARPGGLCAPRWPPSPPLCSKNTPIFQKT